MHTVKIQPEQTDDLTLDDIEPGAAFLSVGTGEVYIKGSSGTRSNTDTACYRITNPNDGGGVMVPMVACRRSLPVRRVTKITIEVEA